MVFAERNVLDSRKDNFSGHLADFAEGKQVLRMSANLPTLFEMSQHFYLDGNLSTDFAFALDFEIAVCSVDVVNREVRRLGITKTAGSHQYGQAPEYRIVDHHEKKDFPLQQNLKPSPFFLRIKDIQERSGQIRGPLAENQ